MKCGDEFYKASCLTVQRHQDTNQAWVYYRHLGYQAMEERRYSEAAGAIYEMIALFPDEYRIEIDTDKYNELIRERCAVVCEKCKTESNRSDVKVFDLLVPLIIQTLIHGEYVKVWVCPKCHEKNNLQYTKFINEKHGLPFYHKVIPEPPIRKNGLQSRRTFHRDMEKWFFEAMEEVDHQLGKLRAEYEGLQTLEEGDNQDAN